MESVSLATPPSKICWKGSVLTPREACELNDGTSQAIHSHVTPVLTRREVCELDGGSIFYLQHPPDHRKVERKKELGE